MSPWTILYGAATLLLTGALVCSRQWRSTDQAACALMMTWSWVIAAALVPLREDVISDFTLPLMATALGLASVRMWSKRHAWWNLVLATGFLLEIATYFYTHAAPGALSPYTANVLLNAVFVVQLIAIAWEPGSHVASAIGSLLQRGAVLLAGRFDPAGRGAARQGLAGQRETSSKVGRSVGRR